MNRDLYITMMAATLMMSAVLACAEEPASFAISDQFVAYIKSGANPCEFGLKDGRFYPYSTPDGRRIGYRQAVADKAWYRQGWPKADAESQLRAELKTSLAELRAMLAKKYPAVMFDRLPHASQEILLDFAYTQGVDRLSDEFCQAVLHADWNKLIDSFLYIRTRAGWPDNIRNLAFATRWIYSGELRPYTAKSVSPD